MRCRQRQTGADRHAVTEDAAGHVHAGGLEAVGVTLVRAIHLSPVIQFGDGKEPRLGKRCIQRPPRRAPC